MLIVLVTGEHEPNFLTALRALGPKPIFLSALININDDINETPNRRRRGR